MRVNCQTLVEHNISLVKTASKRCPICTKHRTRVNKTKISVTKPYFIEQEDGKNVRKNGHELMPWFHAATFSCTTFSFLARQTKGKEISHEIMNIIAPNNSREKKSMELVIGQLS